jgi:hypothetical protein
MNNLDKALFRIEKRILSFATKHVETRLKRLLENYLNTKIPDSTFLEWMVINPELNEILSYTFSMWKPMYNALYGMTSNGDYVLLSNSIKESVKQFLVDFKLFKLNKSYFVKGTNEIPNLNLVILDIDDTLDIDKLPDIELSQNGFIYEAIWNWNYPDALDVAKNFNESYRSNIDKLRHYFEYNPILLGSGSDGVAFDIGKNKVLKIFKDISAFNAAKEAVRRLHLYPELARTEAMIYDVGILGEIYGYKIYFYIIQKMQSINDNSYDDLDNVLVNIVENVNKLKSTLKHIKNELKINDSKIRNNLKQVLEPIIDLISNNVNSNLPDQLTSIDSNNELADNWLELLIEEIIMKYLTSRTDLHIGNLGITNNGELRYFDPAFSNWKSTINV